MKTITDIQNCDFGFKEKKLYSLTLKTKAWTIAAFRVASEARKIATSCTSRITVNLSINRNQVFSSGYRFQFLIFWLTVFPWFDVLYTGVYHILIQCSKNGSRGAFAYQKPFFKLLYGLKEVLFQKPILYLLPKSNLLPTKLSIFFLPC